MAELFFLYDYFLKYIETFFSRILFLALTVLSRLMLVLTMLA